MVGHRKPNRSGADVTNQRKRTKYNQIKRYTKLLAERPAHIHAKEWKKKLDYYENV